MKTEKIKNDRKRDTEGGENNQHKEWKKKMGKEQ